LNNAHINQAAISAAAMKSQIVPPTLTATSYLISLVVIFFHILLVLQTWPFPGNFLTIVNYSTFVFSTRNLRDFSSLLIFGIIIIITTTIMIIIDVDLFW